ncbi:hypothetical protein [Vagococcus fluvialis]|uniref:Uncharacterized protein n=1 Tax=Vagococcus fluvialis TaxID=2738 RepID=A0A7X6D6H4_9ENTE|nr:hypothetical protein [Vagococcus fluvialis]NKC66720.1 hypothetical protein [Vagococcus fluvialis]
MTKKELSVIETAVLELISRGREKRITLKDMMKTIDLDERTLQSVISRLVFSYGIPICATREKFNGSGIYIPSSEKERRDGLVSIKAQTQSMTERINIVESADLNNWTKDLVYNYQEKMEV